MLARAKAVLDANRALRAYENDRLDEALQLVRRARGNFLQAEATSTRQNEVARCYQLEGQILLELNQVEEALECYRLAAELLSTHPENWEDHHRCLHDTGVIFARLGAEDIAAEHFQRAAMVIRDEERKRSYQRENRLASSDVPAFNVAEMADMRRDAYNRARNAKEKADRGFELAANLFENKATLSFDEACDLLMQSCEYHRSHREIANYLQDFDPLVQFLEDVEWPDWLEHETASCLQIATSSGVIEWRAQAHLARSAWLLVRAKLAEALDHALQALALSIGEVLSMNSSMLRSLHSRTADYARLIAVRVAIRSGRHNLATELIEGARQQVLPQVGANLRPQQRSGALGLILDNAARSVGLLRPISVAGESVLRQYLIKFKIPFEEPIAIERFVESVGGAEAWWWGLWAFNDSLFWCIYGGQFREAGEIDISDTSTAGKLVQRLIESSMHNPANKTISEDSGPFYDYRSEEEFSLALGENLLPISLQFELSRRIRAHQAPMSLVVSGNLLTALPVALLGIDVRGHHGFIVRLVEAAIIRSAPPAIFVEHVSNHPQHLTSEHRILVACVDPTNDLKHAGRIPNGASTVLSGRRPGEEGTPLNAISANRNNLVSSLRKTPPSTPGIFYYSGHASTGSTGSDLWSGLELEDYKLAPDNIFSIERGYPSVPFPARVVLSACNSSGAGGAGSGEWFGITAAILWAGARQVMATNWPIWDTPFTADFDANLVDSLRKPVDAAGALRKLQIECLSDWRDPSTSSRGLGNAPLPLIWAAYCCFGVAW